LKGVHPELTFPQPDTDTDSAKNPQVHCLRFTLNRTETSKDGWMQILNSPDFTKAMKVSVGFENDEEMLPSYVVPDPPKTENQVIFTLIPRFHFWLGVVVIPRRAFRL